MKKGIILLSFALLSFGLSGISPAEKIQAKKIKMLFAGEQAIVVLDDHPAVRDFLSMLPLTVTFDDYNEVEKIGYLPRKLHTEGSPSSCNPSVATFAYYAPWGNLSVWIALHGCREISPSGWKQSSRPSLHESPKACLISTQTGLFDY